MSSQTVKQESQKTNSLQLGVALVGTEQSAFILKELPATYFINKFNTLDELHHFLNEQSILTLPDILIIETDPQGNCFDFIKRLKANPVLRDLIIVLISSERHKNWKSRALQLKVHDFYVIPFPIEHLLERLNFLVKFKLIKPQLSVLEDANITYKLPLEKKFFDIVVSVLGILILSPIFLLTAISIKLDSKGPVLYKSKRVGTGYKMFNFYKFRSIRRNADMKLEELADQKVTRFGKFIRKTSIDQLPQLFNVIKGDISMVGNRPLPLNEAKMLTSNEWSQRFMGPAGVTGLWQIKSRGKKEISARERKKFDNFYALKYSFWFDLKIMIKTVPVIFHKEKY